jgi:hypothetical protein
MKMRTISLAVVVVTMTGSACATVGLIRGAPLRKATIELWRTAEGECDTNTTPYFKVRKSRDDKVEWKIVDESDCTEDETVLVEVKFDQDPLPNCIKRHGRKIECALPADAGEGERKYSVWLGSKMTEDPVLEIEQ